LKPVVLLTVNKWKPSPPARGRGLKHGEGKNNFGYKDVAPRTGAWIETGAERFDVDLSIRRRPPHGGVD